MLLPRSASSHVSALPCLWVATLAVFVSPLPTGNHNEIGPVLGASRPPGVQVDLQVIFANSGDSLQEHPVLAIGQAVLHAIMPEDTRGNTPKVWPTADTLLVPSRDDWILETLTGRDHRTENIGKASFVSEEDQEKLIEEMLALKMPRFNQKGTCRDYITMVLKRLRDGGCIDDSVQKAYEKIYKERSNYT
ncbi:uncharacterized protein C8R40DRAFT_1073351 [Lentinula edodes]|uniref:uncharacterized protein n=1 Tax=Lentinula edodes TaxID=5353 RepID=UPI001E8CCACC|nr:uncharacterized protein C8R40DRAFT_1073351 [Lentinula edodes]KAH7870280.1 hypothetical protein C8R40DRAFT_1073351 [Lentinula edodes]KAJ3911833.1 hypothetical protein F5877DRAFT_85497 [Lentinula edodes]